jgi:SAP domain-containing ribonucleoprotein
VARTPPAEEALKKDFAIGIQKTDAEKEAEKRAARAKRFGIAEDDEEKKKLERAKKFGADNALVVKGLDDALPERRAKRGREAADKQGGRNAKRQTPDRRAEAPAKGAAGPAKKPAKQLAKQPAKQLAKQPAKRITDDPVEKAKAEARAKRFQTAA